MRLIDADVFEKNMQKEWENNEISNGEWIHFREMLNQEPTIDAVEVVRCKDCKHYDGRPCRIVDWYNTEDDFCSKAERRTDG